MAIFSSRTFSLKSGGIVIVRSALPDDAQAILDVATSVLAENQFTLTTVEEIKGLQQQVERIADMNQAERAIILLAEVDGRAVGAADFRCGTKKRNAHHGDFGVSVLKPWRDQGVGHALVTTIIDWAAAHPDIEAVRLSVDPTNARAIAVYRKLGFVDEGVLKRSVKYEDGRYADSLLMRRDV
ncbi:MAG: GNAT family N-acetyltransferase [Planctomycetaceae bacterium]|nr:GNAT family N-acetyltransferase [Planctomycetaceae bacterium]